MPLTKITPEYMKEVSKGFKKVFTDALKSQPNDYLKVATEINANSATVDYDFVSDLPSMREWIGDRTLNELKVQKYAISKKDWEASIKVHKDAIVYDNLGIVKPKIQSLAESANEHYEKLVFSLLENTTNLCYDGKTFFATDHPVGSATFSNLGSAALSAEALMSAKAEMRRITKDNGEPLRIKPSLLVVPPELEAKALEILAQTNANGGANITYKMVDLLVCDWLTDAKSWYLFDTTHSLKPFILQINKRAEFTAMDSLTDEGAFMRKEFRYGIDTEDNVGLGFWQMAYKSKVA